MAIKGENQIIIPEFGYGSETASNSSVYFMIGTILGVVAIGATIVLKRKMKHPNVINSISQEKENEL